MKLLAKLERHIVKLWSRVTHRHCVKLTSVGVYNVADYRERYDWLAENIPNFTKTIWMDVTVNTITDMLNTTIEKQLSGQFRFKRKSDSVAFILRWA
jgi:hypothetical protein